MTISIPKSSQDFIGKCLTRWRNNRVAREIRAPFLDIACGDNLLVKDVPGGIGIDVVDYGRANFLVDNIHLLPFKKESFQTVTIVASLNYFDDPIRVLRESERILRVRGVLVLTLLDPFIGKLWHSLREPWAKYPGFSSRQVGSFISETTFILTKKSKFMFGVNNLYVLKKA